MRRRLSSIGLVWAVFLMIVFVAGLAATFSIGIVVLQAEKEPDLRVLSTAFSDGQPIPAKYTCQGEYLSPGLKWAGAPAATKSFALTCDDPDAPVGDWVHWVVYNLPASTAELPESLPKSGSIASGGQQGMNDFKKSGYGGPCPPRGKAHRYFFKVYALDNALSLKPKATMKELVAAMQGHILAQGQLMGTYQRK